MSFEPLGVFGVQPRRLVGGRQENLSWLRFADRDQSVEESAAVALGRSPVGRRGATRPRRRAQPLAWEHADVESVCRKRAHGGDCAAERWGREQHASPAPSRYYHTSTTIRPGAVEFQLRKRKNCRNLRLQAKTAFSPFLFIGSTLKVIKGETGSTD